MPVNNKTSIKIEGIEKLMNKLKDLEKVYDIIEPPMERSVMILQNALAKYPAQRPGSTYRRTGTLGRSWTTRVNREGGRLVGRVGTNVIYAPFVQSQAFQRPVNRSRWQTDVQVVNDQRGHVIKQFQDAIAKALEK